MIKRKFGIYQNMEMAEGQDMSPLPYLQYSPTLLIHFV